MKLKDKKASKKSPISTAMYIFASVVALIGIALLVNNILLFGNTVNQYVAQGYPAATVVNQLIPTQLLPGIFEPIAVYGGIAFILLGVGKVNKKVSQCLTLLTENGISNDVIKESIMEPNVVNVENTDTSEQIESVEEVKND